MLLDHTPVTSIVDDDLIEDQIQQSFDMANSFLKKQNYDKAIVYFKQVLALDPNNANAYGRIAQCKRHLQLFQEALQDINIAIDLDPTCINFYCERRVLFRAIGSVDEALIDYFKVQILLNPHDPENHRQRAQFLKKVGRTQEGLLEMCYAKILLDPCLENHLNLGFCLKELGRLEEAFSTYTRVLAIDDTNSNAWMNLAILCYEHAPLFGSIEDARSHFEKAIECDPDNWRAYHNLAIFEQLSDNHEEALRNYTIAIEITTEINFPYASLHFNRGIIYAYFGLWNKAVRDFKKVKELNDKYVEVNLRLAIVYLNLGQVNDAMKCLDAEINIAPNAAAYYQRALLKEHKGDFVGSLCDQSRAYNLDPNYQDIMPHGTMLKKLEKHIHTISPCGSKIAPVELKFSDMPDILFAATPLSTAKDSSRKPPEPPRYSLRRFEK